MYISYLAEIKYYESKVKALDSDLKDVGIFS